MPNRRQAETASDTGRAPIRSRRPAATLAWLAPSAIALALATGCGQSKAAQCSRLIEKVNANTAAMSASLNKVQQNDDAAQLDQFADLLEKAKQEVARVELDDSKLKGFANQYSAMLDGLATSARSVARAKRDNDAEAFSTAEKAFETVTDEETRILDGLNSYCGAK